MKSPLSNISVVSNIAAAVCCCITLISATACAQSSQPTWSQEHDQAVAVQQKDPAAAEALFSKAVADAVAANDPNANLCGLYCDYGNFLFRRSSFQEAYKMFHLGYASAKTLQQAVWQERFVEREGACQHYLYVAGDFDAPDESLMLKVLPVRSASNDQPSAFRANCFLTLGETYTDKRDFVNSQLYLHKALDEFRRLNDDTRTVNAISAIISDLIEQGRCEEATRVLIAETQNHQSKSFELRTFYRKNIKRKELMDAGIFPTLHKLLKENNFAALEKYADQELSSRSTLPDGRWYLDAFYAELDNPDYIANLKQWVEEKPQSSIAKTALAKALVTYAWKARGTGWSDTVTHTGWSLMGQRLAQGSEMLKQCQTQTPPWYSISQRVALGESWPKDRYNAFVNEAMKKFPQYDTVIFQKAWWLQPRWFGQEGEAEAFVNQEASKRSKVDGDILYARTAWSIDNTIDDVVNQTQMSWPRMKAGLTALIKMNPKVVSPRGELALLALEAGDEETAKNAFSK